MIDNPGLGYGSGQGIIHQRLQAGKILDNQGFWPASNYSQLFQLVVLPADRLPGATYPAGHFELGRWIMYTRHTIEIEIPSGQS